MGYFRNGSGFSAAAGRRKASQIEKETNSSPRRSQRTLRKKIKNNLCVLSELCGEILFGMASNFMKFHTSAASGLKSGPSDRKRN
jgi:hypothetical protein